MSVNQILFEKIQNISKKALRKFEGIVWQPNLKKKQTQVCFLRNFADIEKT